MIASRVSRVRIGLGMAVAVVLGAGGVVAVPDVALAAPWTVTSLSDQGPTATQLAQTLVGPGVTVNSASFTGDASAAGMFDDPAASVGLASGIVLSSGDVHDVVGPNTSETAARTSASLATADSTTLERPDDPGRRQPDRQLHPHQPPAGHQLRLRIGGVRGVRRHRVQRRLRVLRERDQLRAHAGHCCTRSRSTPSIRTATRCSTSRTRPGPTTPSSTASPWSSRVAPRSIPASRTRCGWSLPIPATASTTPACSSRRTVSRRTRSGRCSRSRRTGCSTPVSRRRPASALGSSTQSIVPGGTFDQRQGDRRRRARHGARRGAERHCRRWRRHPGSSRSSRMVGRNLARRV